MASLSDLLTGTGISEFIGGLENNPAYQQAKLQLQNQQPLNQAAWAAYNQYKGNIPQQVVAGLDPTRMAGLQAQLGGATSAADVAATSAGTGIGAQGGLGTSQNVLGNVATGNITPGFSSQVAQDYLSSIMPSLQSAQQSLANQANLNWNKGVGNLGGIGSGFASSGREAALGQATENAATNLAAQQQQLAYNAALQAAQAGQQAGQNQYVGQMGAAGTLGEQALRGAQLTPTLQQGLITPGAITEGVGTTLQQQRQNELNAAYQNALLQQQDPFKALAYLQQGLGVLGSTTQASPYNPQTNMMALLQLLGANNVAGGLGGLVSGGVNLIKDIFKGGSASEQQFANEAQDFLNYWANSPSGNQSSNYYTPPPSTFGGNNSSSYYTPPITLGGNDSSSYYR